MATPKQFIETLTIATSVTGLASIPSGADNAVIRFEGATVRWSETSGSWLTASTGVPFNPGDAPFRVSNLPAFRAIGLANGGVLNAQYYVGFFRL